MKRMICAILLFLLIILPGSIYAESQEQTRSAENGENSRLLQMVMKGSFDSCDPEDSLNIRIFSAVYPLLCNITDEDIGQYTKAFSSDEKEVTSRYYKALANCLWANIQMEKASNATANAVYRVLLLFLNPAGQQNADEQMAEIRGSITEDVYQLLADTVSTPVGFIHWLIEENMSFPD